MWTTGNDIIDGVLIFLALPWLVCGFAAVAMLMFAYCCLVVRLFGVAVDWLLPDLPINRP
jgi:hypothetical protein